MEFKKDKAYNFPNMMAYGFSKEDGKIVADCHLYLGENSFEAMLLLPQDVFEAITKKSDDKTGEFEKETSAWVAGDEDQIFMFDLFPEPVHCKLTGLNFYFIKSEVDEDEFGTERVFYFSTEAPVA